MPSDRLRRPLKETRTSVSSPRTPQRAAHLRSSGRPTLDCVLIGCVLAAMARRMVAHVGPHAYPFQTPQSATIAYPAARSPLTAPPRPGHLLPRELTLHPALQFTRAQLQ